MEVHDPANYRAESHDKYPPFWNVPMLPSAQLMGSVGATTIENFYVVGEAWGHVVGSLLPGGGTVLDIGCGCARTARFLLLARNIEYVGIDNVVFETDYPHQDGTWPNSRAVAEKLLGHLPEESVHKIVRGNAIRLFDLDLPA